MDGLLKWFEIFRFLGMTYIDDDAESIDYLTLLQKFKEDVKSFYDVGSRTFLISMASGKSTETFYMHVLRYYLPEIALKTFQIHKVGVGIFSMQGFERRNKESKRCMSQFSNHKGNQTINNMKRVFDIFCNSDKIEM